MENINEAQILRIFISSTDKFKHSPLYEMIVYAAKRYNMAGATVLKGAMGYGSSNIIRSSSKWELTEKLPMVVEIIDEPEQITNFINQILPWFDKIETGCLITTEAANIVLHKKGKKQSFF